LNVFNGFNHENVIKNIENAKKYLSESLHEDLQTIIKDNKSKEPKYGTPEDCRHCVSKKIAP
jgi:hypothetical protein